MIVIPCKHFPGEHFMGTSSPPNLAATHSALNIYAAPLSGFHIASPWLEKVGSYPVAAVALLICYHVWCSDGSSHCRNCVLGRSIALTLSPLQLLLLKHAGLCPSTSNQSGRSSSFIWQFHHAEMQLSWVSLWQGGVMQSCLSLSPFRRPSLQTPRSTFPTAALGAIK